jgi:purine-binding chemotaxis protein CheW
MNEAALPRSDEQAAAEFVTAVIDGQLFGLPIERVLDVFVPAYLARVPLAPAEIAGLLNLRGRIVTVIDMRRRLGLPDRPTTEAAMAIGIEHNGDAYGLLVDSVGEVMRISNAVFAAKPVSLDPRIDEVSVGVYRLEGELMIVLDVDRVLDHRRPARAA